MIYVSYLLILVGAWFLARPAGLLVESRYRGITTYGVTPSGCVGLVCCWTGFVFSVAMAFGGMA